MYRLVIFLLNACFWLLSRLPLRVLQHMGACLGLLAAWLPGRYQRRLRTHFLRAYPHATPAMLAEAARSAGRMALEMPYFWARKRPLAQFPHLLDAHDATLTRLLAQGRGVIALTVHMGCFEILAPALAARYGLTALFKPPHKTWLRQWMEGVRSQPGLHLAPAQARGVRMMVKALRHGQMAAMLPDQAPAAGEGVWAPFFGQPAYTVTLVQKLQQRSGAPIVLFCCERLPHAQGYQVHLRCYEAMLPDSPVAAATALNQAIEALIAIAPTQYLWGYNRYKIPQGVQVPL
ncbi:MAG: lysophospholipid acyltransferase family protein [Ottowia sp.]|nr:lysophospholipid acyltransferase family protein [Ottowia sp.]